MFIRSIITSKFNGGWLIPILVILSLIVFISHGTRGVVGVGRGQVGNGREKTITVQDLKYISLQTPPAGYPEPTEPNPTPQSPESLNSTGSYPPPFSTVIRQTPYPNESNIEAPIGIPTVGMAATIASDFDAGLSTELTNPATESTLVSSGIILWIGFLIGLAFFSAAVLAAVHYTRRDRQK